MPATVLSFNNSTSQTMTSKQKHSVGLRVNATDLANINAIRKHIYATKGIFYDTSTTIRLAIEKMANDLKEPLNAQRDSWE